MATILKRSREGARPETFVRLKWPGFDPLKHLLVLNREGAGEPLPLHKVEPTDFGWRLPQWAFTLEHFVLDGEGELQLVVFDRERSEIIGGEPVELAPSFFEDVQDRIAFFQRWEYERPARIAAFTHVCNEGVMLPVFIRHYSRIVDPGGLYVVNHGSAPEQIDPVRETANVVDIPRGETDHINIANFCGYFQRFLLTQYDWVIHVDCDELLLTTRADNDLRKLVTQLPPGTILKPARAYDVTHRIDDEAPLDFSLPASLQRSRLFPNDAFCKPVLANTPVTWSIGFHQCLEPAQAHDELCIVHLRDADLDHAERRNRKWNSLTQSSFDQQVVGNNDRQSRDVLAKRLREQEADAQTIDMPEWMKGRF